MKSLFKSMVLAIIGLAIFSHAEVWGEDWKLFSVGSEGIFWWYDSQGVTYHPDKMIRVWVKKVKAEEIFAMIKSGAKIDRLELEKMISERDYERSLMEIDCVERTVNRLQKLNYDSKGVLKSGESKLGTKKDIPPESVAEQLYKRVCK